ncbi:hypothetical protein DYI95_002065 [Thermaerobacter sp. PB12/4term]|uniref:sensor histidine kinase n=1 Tax=Thermaerobacter sp. PB12/4term TaxID=2293838 RepID=UPI000E328FE0|nr:ATP-binding protein [Thermaerobacter sp. PB12/4term]QIA26481.1 hypothetical protein DYI95_002065 [Thermaerobacter sp. PB12/4term]
MGWMNPRHWRWILAGVPAVATALFETVRHSWFEPVPHAHAGNLLGALATGLAASVCSWAVAAKADALYHRLRQVEAEAARRHERDRLVAALHDDVAQRLFWIGVELDELVRALGSVPLREESGRSQMEPVRPTSSGGPMVSGASKGFNGRAKDIVPDLEALRRRLGAVRSEVDAAYGAVRHALHGLHEGTAATGVPSFWDALRRIANELDLDVQVAGQNGRGDGLPTPPPHAASDALAIVAEALRNVAKHADTRQARVEASLRRPGPGSRERFWCLTIADSGRGFDPGRDTGGLGLSLMQERAERVGGHLEVRSRPGRGTQIELRIPANPYRGGLYGANFDR